MRKSALRAIFAAVTSLGFLCGVARATVLTFDITETSNGGWVGNFTAAPQDYGDRVTAFSTTSGLNTYDYGSAEGPTPNIEVSYGPPVAAIDLWDNNYGDLNRVIFPDNDGVGILEVTLTADPGYEVNLHGFDMGGWNRSDYTINLVEVVSGTTTLFSSPNAAVAGAGPSHTVFDFMTPLMAQTMTIRFDSANLGSLSDNIGMDNIAFSQVEAAPHPIPAALPLFVTALIGVVILAARKRRPSLRPAQ